MGRHEEWGRRRSSQALFPSVLSDEVVLLKRLCLLWPGVTFGTLVDISSSVVSESKELVSWQTVSLGILQQDFSQSFAWLWDFLMLHICRECHFYHHTVGVFLLKCLCYPPAMGDLLPVFTVIIHLHHLCQVFSSLSCLLKKHSIYLWSFRNSNKKNPVPPPPGLFSLFFSFI